MKRTILFILIVSGLFVATACTPTRVIVDYDPIVPENNAAPDSFPTATPEILADCFQWATATVWLDENGNGVWDDGEAPLAGIEFVLEPTVYSRTLSDENGIAEIFATTPGAGCPENQQVMAVRFDGYVPTTEKSLAYTGVDTEYLFGFQPLPASTLVETEAYTGAIFSAEKTAVFISWLGESADDFWTPTVEEVAAFEAGLPSYLQTVDIPYRDTQPILERLPAYTRQYFGLVRGDEQLIYGNFFCDTWEMDWGETAVVVMDGGDCYFQVTYDVNTGEYTSLWINGEA